MHKKLWSKNQKLIKIFYDNILVEWLFDKEDVRFT